MEPVLFFYTAQKLLPELSAPLLSRLGIAWIIGIALAQWLTLRRPYGASAHWPKYHPGGAAMGALAALMALWLPSTRPDSQTVQAEQIPA